MFVIALLCAGAAKAAGTAAKGGFGDESEQTISAKDLKAAFEPYIPAVRDCYAVNAQGRDPDGNLRLELIIQRDGTVFRFGFDAPGLTGAWLRRLDGCLRPLSESWHFPVRRGFTTAVLPFYFQRTFAPKAGPVVGGRS